MTKRLLLTLALLSAAPAAHAQVRFSAGPQLGYTLTSTGYQFYAIGVAYSTHYRSGVAGGLTAELGLGHWLVRSALSYTQKGYNQDEVRSGTSSSARRMRTDYLVLPLQLGYSQRPDGQGLQVFAGPYVGRILGGHYSVEVAYAATASTGAHQETYSGGVVAEGSRSSTSNYVIRPWDFGLQGGVGYRYRELLAQLEYSQGLLNVDANRDWAGSFYGSSAYRNQ